MTTKIHTLRYSNETTARNVASRTEKPSMIILGDDEKYWVVSLADGEKLIRSGYEAI